jgi:outer membrane protein assembly factor BamD (BamD/ComL family)
MDSIILAATAVNKDEGNKAIRAFVDFSTNCSNDSLAPVFLIKSAQIAQAVNNLPQAKLSLEKCILDFPKFKDRGAAMFLLAQLYDDPRYLNNEIKAMDLYKEIISVYPKTPWAANATAAMELAGKSDEQIIREFEKKNSKK